MKTLKTIPYLLMGGLLAIGTACSSTNTTTAESGSAGNNAGLYSSMGGTAAGTSTTGQGAASPGAVADPNAAGSAGAAGGGNASGSAAMGASGTADATDMTAFAATFATMKDPVFLMNAASSNMLEIRMGQMAAQKASSADVRKFAQMMVSHHSNATQELKAIAVPLSVTLPTTMMPVHQALADRLMDKRGKEFDETYMDVMEAAHKMDIAMFEVKSNAAEVPSVQAFATKSLPMLRSHHTMADNIEKKVD